MSKKFDVVIGNPPYQDSLIGENSAKTPPVYHLFIDAAFEVSRRTVLITPARFLSNAGQTPKSWNQKILTDEHVTVAHFEPDSAKVFPGTSIDGGIVITYRDSERLIGPIGDNAHLSNGAKAIVERVSAAGGTPISDSITEHPCSWSSQVFVDHPELRPRIPESSGLRLKTNTFERMHDVCLREEPRDGNAYLQILGLFGKKRETRWVRREYVVIPGNVDKFKVVISSADGAAVKAGRIIGTPTAMPPGVGHTQTFMSIGAFDTATEAEACASYLRTKFARAMLKTLKTTQHNSAVKWRNVPLQDFTPSSDIDWALPVAEIDRQLYAKYKLEDSEIEFIESHIQPMG